MGKNINNKEKTKVEIKDPATKKQLKTKLSVTERVITVRGWLKQHYNLRRNEITKNLEHDGEPVPEERLLSMYLKCLVDVNEWFTYSFFEQCVFAEDSTEYYNPFNDYLAKNAHRTSKGNIDKLCQCIDTDTKYYTNYIRKWMISLIAAIDGCAVRYVLTFTGAQHIGKTRFFEDLLPAALQGYSVVSDLSKGKDDELLMTQKLLICVDELSSKTYEDVKKFKTLTSKSSFSLRPPYGRANKDFKRLAVLCATANDTEILNDLTGNTRILPVDVNSINFILLNSIDRDELFMEAYRLYKSGAEWWLTKEELEKLEEESDAFKAVSVEREMLIKYIKKPSTDSGVWMSNTDIANYIRERSNMPNLRLSPKILGAELNNIIGKRVCRRVNGVPIKMYFIEKVGVVDGISYSWDQAINQY